MGTEKGLFKDDDKFSPRHQELTDWIAVEDNARQFTWEILRLPVKSVQVEIEVPVYSPTRFLFGFADSVVSVHDSLGRTRKVLFEFKSSLRDYAAVLRQIQTYRTNISKIDHTVLIVNGSDDWALDDDDAYSDEFLDLARRLYSQQVYLYDFFSVQHTLGAIDHKYAVPSEDDLDERGRIKI